MHYTIDIQKTNNSRLSEIDFSNIPFGTICSDHMFIADYKDGKWQDARIEPYQDIAFSPANFALHYGQSVFEGIKAYRDKDGNPTIFRPEKNAKRFNISAERMYLPEVPEELFLDAIKELIAVDSQWIPEEAGSSLYIRPFLFANDSCIGIRPPQEFKFMVITCPVGRYYDKPVKVKVADKYVRAAPGGTGFAKACGNYAAAMKPWIEARSEGYDQILWMDGVEFKYVQEIGTMNLFFVVDGTVLTPELGDTILDGVTRDSVLQLLKDKNIPIEIRAISIDELEKAYNAGRLEEAFGTGTAATVTSISTIGYKETNWNLPEITKNSIAQQLKQEMADIKNSKIPDRHNWLTTVQVEDLV